jgi:hypothetical protein
MKFKKFLEENGALEAFETNCKNERSDSVKEIIGRWGLNCVLEVSFKWVNTPEGRDFWKTLNTKWEATCNEQLNNETD